MLKFLTFCFLTVGLVNGFGGMSLPGTEEPEGCCCSDVVIKSVHASACSSVSMASMNHISLSAEAASTAELQLIASTISVAKAVTIAQSHSVVVANSRANVILQASYVLTAISTAFADINNRDEFTAQMTGALTAVNVMSEGHADASMWGEAESVVEGSTIAYDQQCQVTYGYVKEFEIAAQSCESVTAKEAEVSANAVSDAALTTVACGADEQVLTNIGLSLPSTEPAGEVDNSATVSLVDLY